MSEQQSWAGGPASPSVVAVLAPNPGPMTLDGTNTWVVGREGADDVLVVDPGPLDEGHLRAVLDLVASRGSRVGLTVLTHRHEDHTEAADRWVELTGAPVRGAGRGEPWTDGETLRVGGLDVTVRVTPGHTSDSVCLVVPSERVLLSGDTVLGRGTSVVAHPDGDVGDYLASLETLCTLADDGTVATIAPGHGPVLTDASAVLHHYLDHRRERLRQVADALDAGAREADDVVEAVVERVYAEVPRSVWPAARLIVRAQLRHLGVDA